jgi:TRAP-type C4-dicarboxylate transport system permease small subunit
VNVAAIDTNNSGSLNYNLYSDFVQGAQAIGGKILMAVRIIAGLAAVAAFAFIVIGGFKYIMSKGEPKMVEEGKKTLVYAGAGLFIIGVGWIILEFFLSIAGLK